MNRYLQLALAAVVLLAFFGVAYPAGAAQCNDQPWEGCLYCCYFEFETCLTGCQGQAPGCVRSCYEGYYSCEATCIYAPRSAPNEPTSTDEQSPTDEPFGHRLTAGGR